MKTAFTTFLVLLCTLAFTQDKMAHNIDNSNIALQGYSPVSYLDLGLAQIGSKSFSTEHEKVKYFFTSAEQKAAFDKNPGKYLPQFGGYCAFGVYAGAKFRVDPDKFLRQDGKYYLFLNNVELDALQLWQAEDHATLLGKAKVNWKKLSKTHN